MSNILHISVSYTSLSLCSVERNLTCQWDFNGTDPTRYADAVHRDDIFHSKRVFKNGEQQVLVCLKVNCQMGQTDGCSVPLLSYLECASVVFEDYMRRYEHYLF